MGYESPRNLSILDLASALAEISRRKLEEITRWNKVLLVFGDAEDLVNSFPKTQIEVDAVTALCKMSLGLSDHVNQPLDRPDHFVVS
jgi:hypothetical protein